MKSKKKVILLLTLIAMLAVICILLCVYMQVQKRREQAAIEEKGRIYETEFYPNTTINGIDVSEMTPEEAEKKILEDYNDYELKISFRGNQEETIKGETIGYECSLMGSVADLLQNQNYKKWQTESVEKHAYTIEVSTSYDEKKLTNMVKSLKELDTKKMKAPVDAYVTYVKEESFWGYKIVPEEDGTTLDVDETSKAIYEAVENIETELDITKGDYYESPEVTEDTPILAAQVEQLSEYANAYITYDLQKTEDEKAIEEAAAAEGTATDEASADTNNRESFETDPEHPFADTTWEENEINPARLRSWLTQDDEGNYVRDDEQFQETLAAFVTELTSDITSGDNVQKFNSTMDGLQYVELGEYSVTAGFTVDLEKELTQLQNEIANHAVVEREPTYLGGIGSSENYGIGNTYVEINLSRQKLWYYKDGQCLLDTNIVSGAFTTWRYTPEGVYSLAIKSSPHTMKGEINPATNQPIYIVQCTYWMNFVPALGIGMHDLSSRSNWSSTAARDGNGSHGCINMKTADAQYLYSIIEVGTPVICYYSEPYTLTQESGPSGSSSSSNSSSGSTVTPVPTAEPTPAPNPTSVPTPTPTPNPTAVPTPDTPVSPEPDPSGEPDPEVSEEPTGDDTVTLD